MVGGRAGANGKGATQSAVHSVDQPAYMKLDRALFEQMQSLPSKTQKGAFLVALLEFFFDGAEPENLPHDASVYFEANRVMLTRWRRNVINGARNRPASTGGSTSGSTSGSTRGVSSLLPAESQIVGTHPKADPKRDHNKQLITNNRLSGGGAVLDRNRHAAVSQPDTSDSSEPTLLDGVGIVENSDEGADAARIGARADAPEMPTYETWAWCQSLLDQHPDIDLPDGLKAVYSTGYPLYNIRHQRERERSPQVGGM